MIKKLILLLIRFYQNLLSFDTGIGRYFTFGAKICRHSPTCSQYTYNVIKKYGVIKGILLGVKRVVGCSALENFKLSIFSFK